MNEILSALWQGAILGVQFGSAVGVFLMTIVLIGILSTFFITTYNFFLKDKPNQEKYKHNLRNSTGVRAIYKNTDNGGDKQ